jgi:hypothetical protein
MPFNAMRMGFSVSFGVGVLVGWAVLSFYMEGPKGRVQGSVVDLVEAFRGRTSSGCFQGHLQ